MRANNLKAILKAATLIFTILIRGDGGPRPAAGQFDCCADQHDDAGWLDGADVGLQLRHCCNWLTATCARSNPLGTGWSPVVITVPTGATGGLTIKLTNYSFSNSNSVPTSIMIVGQVGGGLGTAANHHAESSPRVSTVTWPTAGSGPTNVPPPQGPRVQSFGTEVAAGATTSLNWPVLKPGTYLLESGTHPSIQGPMGLYGILVVTAAPTATTTTPTTETAPGCAYPAATAGTCAVPYDAEVPVLLSEIDPVQNNAVSFAVNAVGFSETTVWSGQPGGCGNPSTANAGNYYPPAVNYTPLYYMINGVAFNKTIPNASLFPITPATIAPLPHWFRVGALRQRGLAYARSFDRGIASSRADGCIKSDRHRFQDHCGRWQSTAGRAEGANRRVYGRRQSL